MVLTLRRPLSTHGFKMCSMFKFYIPPLVGLHRSSKPPSSITSWDIAPRSSLTSTVDSWHPPLRAPVLWPVLGLPCHRSAGSWHPPTKPYAGEPWEPPGEGLEVAMNQWIEAKIYQETMDVPTKCWGFLHHVPFNQFWAWKLCFFHMRMARNWGYPKNQTSPEFHHVCCLTTTVSPPLPCETPAPCRSAAPSAGTAGPPRLSPGLRTQWPRAASNCLADQAAWVGGTNLPFENLVLSK